MARGPRVGAERRLASLSRRERQCLDVLFQRGGATVAEVRAAIEDPPSYSAVRATLNILVAKGHAQHRQDGPRYVYEPAIAPDSARSAAVRHLVKTFFGGSPEEAMAALLDLPDTRLTRETVTELTRRIQAARREGR